MKTILMLSSLVISTAASAACYQIFAPNNTLVWQNAMAPVPMDSRSIAGEVGKMVPGGHLVIVDDLTTTCYPLDIVPKKAPAKRVGKSRKGSRK